ncbi:MAG: hypothetical protein OK422_01935 [Thaumarchaeota archaeon]|nr:hypothetical protein [Nitrososphaerota archaeon]
MKIANAAAVIGLITGLWTAWNNWVLSTFPHIPCDSNLCATANPFYVVITTSLLGVVLIISSVTTFVGPKVVLYLSAILSILIAVTSVLIFELGIINSTYFLATLALSIISAFSSILAARSKVRLPTGSHPMDLPVFG